MMRFDDESLHATADLLLFLCYPCVTPITVRLCPSIHVAVVNIQGQKRAPKDLHLPLVFSASLLKQGDALSALRKWFGGGGGGVSCASFSENVEGGTWR